jgi:hypothetical protein
MIYCLSDNLLLMKGLVELIIDKDNINYMFVFQLWKQRKS